MTITWQAVSVALGAFVLLYGAAEKIINIISILKKPNQTQNEKIKSIENRCEKIEERLNAGNSRFMMIDESTKVSQMALLALLDHSIDGNNIEQLRSAKEALREHLIGKGV